MQFLCEDLRQFGVELIPPSAPEFDSLLADIRGRIDNPVEGSPPRLERISGRIDDADRETSAILVNRSPFGIAAIQQLWSFTESGGRAYTSSTGPGANNPSILLPYGIPEKALKLYGHWHVILPGSKRYLSRNGSLLGDNNDVRPPAGDEVWTGGMGGGGGGGGRSGGGRSKVSRSPSTMFSSPTGDSSARTGKNCESRLSPAQRH